MPDAQHQVCPGKDEIAGKLTGLADADIARLSSCRGCGKRLDKSSCPSSGLRPGTQFLSVLLHLYTEKLSALVQSRTIKA